MVAVLEREVTMDVEAVTMTMTGDIVSEECHPVTYMIGRVKDILADTSYSEEEKVEVRKFLDRLTRA